MDNTSTSPSVRSHLLVAPSPAPASSRWVSSQHHRTPMARESIFVAVQLAAFALPPAAHSAPLLGKFIINQAKAVIPVIPTVVPGGAADVATAGVTTPVTLDSALDPAINPQKLAAAPLAATTPAYDWTQDPILYPIISFGFGVLVIVVPVLIAAVIAIPQWLFEVVREVVESVFGLPAQPAVAGVSVATAEAKATTAPTLTSDPTLSHSRACHPCEGGTG